MMQMTYHRKQKKEYHLKRETLKRVQYCNLTFNRTEFYVVINDSPVITESRSTTDDVRSSRDLLSPTVNLKKMKVLFLLSRIHPDLLCLYLTTCKNLHVEVIYRVRPETERNRFQRR